MEKLILGIISTIITPIVIIRSYLEMRKYESDYRASKKHKQKRGYSAGLNKSRLLAAVFTFFLGIYLLYEYFSGG